MWRLLFIATVLLLLVACGGETAQGPVGESVSLDSLPAGYGRGFTAAFPANSSEGKVPVKGEPAPDFYLQLDSGEHIRLADLKGRPVMLNFWATWCPPCRMEMPDIVAASEADDELVVLAVNVLEDKTLVEPFASEFEMTMPVLLDSEGMLRNAYNVQGMPTSVFIDRRGDVAAVWSGLLTAEKLDEMLAAIR